MSCDGALFWCDLPLELRGFAPNNQVGKDTRAGGVGAKSGTRGNYPNLGCIIMIAAVQCTVNSIIDTPCLVEVSFMLKRT